MSLEQEQLTRELLDFIDEEETDELDIKDKQIQKIENTNQANYYVKKLKEIQEQKEDITETCQRQIRSYTEKVNAWQERMFSNLDNEENYYNNLLKDYALEQLEGTKKKTLKLIEGTLSFRKTQPKYTYDEDNAIQFIENTDLPYLKTKATLELNDLDLTYEIKDDNQLYINGVKIGTAQVKKSIDKTKLKKDGIIKNNKLYIEGVQVDGVEVEILEDNFIVK